jgi:glycosyltransferase involved in cell wall biosynthesis
MKIAVYAIVLNEIKFVERFVESAAAADLIFVADTGSTDGTTQKLEELANCEYPAGLIRSQSISIKPWRFDDARNTALALLPDDIDVCVSLDLDEVLQPGWREEIERVWIPGTTRLRYGFDWGAGIQFQYEKIHGRHGYRWFLPCHEYPVSDRITESWANTDKLLVVHQPDPEKSRGQYLDLLRISVEENPTEPRNAFYYARELSFRSMWREAIVEAQRYLLLPRATWANERCYAMRVIARSHQELGQWADALKWLRDACSEAPETREPWYELALACYRTSRWAESLGAALTCLGITNREKVYTVDPNVWTGAPHDLASIAAWNLGQHALAIEHAKKAVELSPDDFRLRQNLEACLNRVVAA